MMYELNPLLLIHPATENGKRVLVATTDWQVNPLVLLDYRIPYCISVLPYQFDVELAIQRWSISAEVFEIADVLWKLLVDYRIIISLEKPDAQRLKIQDWERHGWGNAVMYHEATKDYPFVHMNKPSGKKEDRGRMLEYMEVAMPPNIYHEKKHFDRVSLPKIHDGDNVDALAASFSENEKKEIPGLGLVFDLVFGERDFHFPGILKTSNLPNIHKITPSGGARHPNEAYLANFSISTLETGLYHYNVEHNSLDLYARGNYFKELKAGTLDLFLKYKDELPRAMLVISSRVERAMWRYRDSRSWRAILMDAGHSLRAFRTVCQVLDIKTYPYQKFKDEEVSLIFEIDPYMECPLLVCSLY
jgi:SagB-type dehydrogenase family enzyme